MTTEELAKKAIQICRERGADQAGALVIGRHEKAVQLFNRESPLTATSDTTRFTLRLFSGRRGAVATGLGSTEQAIESTIGQAMAFIGQGSQDKFLGLAEARQLGSVSNDLGIYDQALADMSLSDMRDLVASVQPALTAKDARVGDLASSTFQVQMQEVAVCTSEGYCETYRTTMGTLSANAVLDPNGETEGTAAENRLAGGANLTRRKLSDLNIDRLAEMAISGISAKAGAKPAGSGWLPVVFAPTASRNLAAVLLQFCSGPVAMYMQGSYFGKLGETICSPVITLVDDPLRVGGLKSQPFDHEGVIPVRKVIVQNGVFSEYLLNAYYGRVLERESTGNAVSNEDIRLGVGPSNAFIEAGTSTPESIIADVRQGFYVTKLTSRAMHVGTNFTQAATGSWIEGGRLTHPVRTAIISAPLKQMFKSIVACGNDVDNQAPLAAPTMLVSKMNISPLA